ncbi:contactin-like [Ruditapes philippinarum]|uniref:contactin-like n=1 Tax=Ruditapes philippinarum TaxID=129788 RepID=UPI00295B68D0|nr:contactin-like [Ruditapes philippinarum]
MSNLFPLIVCSFVLFLANNVICQTILGLGCPLGWEPHGDSCYEFVFEEAKVYDDAATACWGQGSSLVSVNDIGEHNFIAQYLERHGKLSVTEWYTSGQRIGDYVKWNGDGTYSNDTVTSGSYWIIEPIQIHKRNDKVIYKFSAATRQYGWSQSSGSDQLNYICEIPKSEVPRLIQQTRDFAFGEGDVSADHVPKGPSFLNDIENVVVVGNLMPLVVDCVATGYPQPELHWFVKNAQSSEYKMITSQTNNRYTFANGRMTISTPNEREDAGVYECRAQNNQGTIVSAPVMISFGYLNQFSPNRQGFVQGKLSQGTFISCKAPNSKPALSYTWYKDNIRSFIRPELNKYYFISANGNLYLSEVQEPDAGEYFCVVTLVPRVGERLSTSQPPSRTSRPIELRVASNNPLDYGPIIHPDFIAVYPKPPLVGHEVRLECFAYGRLPLQYSWSREGKNFPPGTRFMYDDRVMIIPNAQFADSGNYTCKVVKLSGNPNIVSKSVILDLEAKPYFVFPLRNIHADVQSELTWRCEARAVPRATYTWFKNGNMLTGVSGEIEVRENVLVIKHLDKSRDEGMYQCQANNPHGTSRSSAQLRVLSIKPSFARFPLPSSAVASEGGNLTLRCQPEAAPQPNIEWLHNGQSIGYGDMRREILIDGTLHVTQVSKADQGLYTCKASNVNGEDTSSTQVSVMAGIFIQTAPLDQTVHVNKTTFLFCDASYDNRRYDLTYTWTFNGRPINTENDPFYRDGRRENINGLYIVNAQYRHSGVYECIAESVTLAISRTAVVTVKGPPTEPAGVYIESGTGNNGTVRLIWTWNPSADHGYPVIFFEIEAMTEFSKEWEPLASDVQAYLTLVQPSEMKRFFELKNLLPYNSYKFRVRAVNEEGVGPPSRQSNIYHVPAAPPRTVPVITSKGGGAVGLLRIEWTPLPRSEEGGAKFGYKVYWQLATETQKAFHEVEVGNVTQHYETVGTDNFYLLYKVRIQAYNKEGYGPMSDYYNIYSAEGIPTIRPNNVRYTPINGTALLINWDPVPNTREAIKGRVRGYRIDYIDKNDPIGGQRGSTFAYGQRNNGTIIGLDPNGDYWVRVTVFNSAGISTISEKYLCSTYEAPPGRFPQFVEILPHGQHSARVKWRGVNIIQGEATLDGYKLMYWPVGDDIRTANFTLADVGNEAVIYGLQIDVIYKLRVMATNRGGDGKKSPTLYFSVLQGGAININRAYFDPSTSQILIAAGNNIFISYITICLTFVSYLVLK